LKSLTFDVPIGVSSPGVKPITTRDGKPIKRANRANVEENCSQYPLWRARKSRVAEVDVLAGTSSEYAKLSRK
jgi:hypothetical protein